MCCNEIRQYFVISVIIVQIAVRSLYESKLIGLIHFCRRWTNLPRQWLVIPVRREHPVVCHGIGDYSMEGPLKLPVLSRTLLLGAVVKCSLQISPERCWPYPVVLPLLLSIVRGFRPPHRTAGGMVSAISTVFRPFVKLSLLHKVQGSVCCGILLPGITQTHRG